jgi:hypothetical protein
MLRGACKCDVQVDLAGSNLFKLRRPERRLAYVVAIASFNTDSNMISIRSDNLKRSSSNPAIDEPSAKRQLTTTMKTVPDDFDSDAHKAMDMETLRQMADDPYAPSSLLSSIVAASKGRLDHRHGHLKSARELIAAHPELKEMLDSAWESKSFRDVRNLSLWT